MIAWPGILFFACLVVAMSWLIALRLARRAGRRVSNAQLSAVIAAGDRLAKGPTIHRLRAGAAASANRASSPVSRRVAHAIADSSTAAGAARVTRRRARVRPV